ncbi:TPA: hypothetical protein ACH3X1_005515 [Trebouxia sp. C0004]
MMGTMQRQSSTQPAAAVAARDRATVELVLQKTINELQGVRQQLSHVTDTATASKVLLRVEKQLKSQTQELLELHESGLTHQDSISSKPAPLKWIQTPGPQRALRSSADSAKQALLENAVRNPQTARARRLIAAVYGVTNPLASTARTGLDRDMLAAAAVLQMRPCTQHGMLLTRYDPTAVIMDIPDAEIHRGLYELVTRGLLPKSLDATPAFEGDVLALTGAMLHKRTAVPAPMPATAADMLLPQVAPILHQAQDIPQFTPLHCTSSIDSVLNIASSDSQFQRAEDPYTLASPSSPSPLLPPRDPSTTRSDCFSPQPRAESPSLEAARQYEQLMDSHSLHEFMIRYGQTLSSTPEFTSYQRVYAAVWPVLAELILHLEGICAEYAVPLVVVDGKQLGEVARDSIGKSVPPPMEDLLACVKNIRQIALLLQQPGRRFKGPAGPQAAAVCIQAHWRGYITRQKLGRDPCLDAAAAHIQNVWRRHQGRKSGLLQIRKMQQARDTRFLQLQDSLVRNWSSIHERKHVVIHLPSLGLTEGQRQGLSKPQLRENSQMARLCDLADPLVEVVYVAPFNLPQEVETYWRKLLEVCAVDKLAVRCRLVIPENCSRLPAHMSLTAKLLASPRALTRIQQYCKNRPGYIVPGTLGGEEVDLAVKLGLPLLAPHPSIGRHFSLKSGAKQLFRSAKVNVAPGMELDPRAPAPPQAFGDVDSLGPGGPLTEGGIRYTIHPVTGHLITTELPSPAKEVSVSGFHAHKPQREDKFIIKSLAQLIVQHSSVLRWLMKIDDEHLGRGHAYVDVATVPAVATALQLYATTLNRLPEVYLEPNQAAAAKDALDLCIYQVTQHLAKAIQKVVVVAGPEAYPSWSDFAAGFTKRGGVIEACASGVIGSPSVNLFIDPLGRVRLISTHEQMFCPPYRVIGSSFPQSSVPPVPLTEAALAVGTACYNAKIIGHVEVDFVASREDDRLRLWAVDLNVCPTASLSSFQLFDFLAAGQFDPVSGTYWVPGMPEMSIPAGLPDQTTAQPEAIGNGGAPQGGTQQEGGELCDAAPALPEAGTSAGQNSSTAEFEQGNLDGCMQTDLSESNGAAATRGDEQVHPDVPSQFGGKGDQQQSTAHMVADAVTMHSSQSDAAGPLHITANAAVAKLRVENLDAGADLPVARQSSQLADRDYIQGHAEAAHTAGAESPDSGAVSQPQSWPLTSSSTVQVHEQTEADMVGGSTPAWQQSESDIMQHEVQLQPRFYAAIDLLCHSGMHRRRSAQFLQNCRLAGLGFDMMARQGLVLNFMDSMSSCCLGVQSAGPTPQAALQALSKALGFMVSQFGEIGLDGPNKQRISDPDASNFRNFYATIRFLADRTS